MIFNKQNIKNRSFKVGFYSPENKTNWKIQAKNKTYWDKNLTISSMQDLQDLFSFNTPFEFWN